jgi:hypothetical protein
MIPGGIFYLILKSPGNLPENILQGAVKIMEQVTQMTDFFTAVRLSQINFLQDPMDRFLLVI